MRTQHACGKISARDQGIRPDQDTTGVTMTITTTAPTAHADVDLITALDAGMLDFQTPSADALAILTNTAIASGRERGIIAAQIIERIVPDGVQIEEINCGRDAKVRGVFLHQDDVDHIAVYFFA